jgi:hypothetical protein
MKDQDEGAASHRFLALGSQGRSRDFLPAPASVPQLLTVCGRGEPMPARPKVLGNGAVSRERPLSMAGRDYTAFKQSFFDIPVAQAEAKVEPHGMADDLNRKPVILVFRNAR